MTTKTEKDDKQAELKNLTPYHGKINVENHIGRYDLDVYYYGKFVKTVSLPLEATIA